jgi:hypothetical protein
MTIRKNKFLSLITLLTLVMLPVFIAAFFLVQLTMIRHEMKEQLELQSLQTIRIAEKNISWVEKGKELVINGKLFDVKSLKKTGDYLEVTGLFDELELKLQHQLIFFQNPEKNHKQKQEFIYQILVQQKAEKIELSSWESTFFINELIFNPSLPDIMLRAPHLLLLSKPPEAII